MSCSTSGTPKESGGSPRCSQGAARGRRDLLFTSGEAATNAARQATRTIPIVFTLIGDPVAAKIVERLAHPGGNVTGVSSLTTVLVAKRSNCCTTMVPDVKRVWVIYAADEPSSRAALANAEEAGPRLALTIEARAVKSEPISPPR
jgi:putative ABC transport system substrate-binding protein